MINFNLKREIKKAGVKRATKSGDEVMMGQVRKVLGSQGQGIILMVRDRF